MKKKYFPLFFDLSSKKVLVVGAGDVAYRRIKSLLDFSVQITVIASNVDERIRELQQNDPDLEIIKMQLRPEDFQEMKTMDGKAARLSNGMGHEDRIRIPKWDIEEGIKGADIILAATSDSGINSLVTSCARTWGKWVNNASSSVECDFFFPALANVDEITVGIAGDGRNHRRVREVARQIRDCLRDGADVSPDFCNARAGRCKGNAPEGKGQGGAGCAAYPNENRCQAHSNENRL